MTVYFQVLFFQNNLYNPNIINKVLHLEEANFLKDTITPQLWNW